VPDIERCDGQTSRLLDLYRTVRTANSPEYRFLCAYKLIRLLSISQAQSPQLRERVEAESVTKETLVISGMIKYWPELEGRKFSELPELFRDWQERLITQIADTDKAAESLDFLQLDELNCISNLLDIACHRVLSQVVGNLTATETAHEAAE